MEGRASRCGALLLLALAPCGCGNASPCMTVGGPSELLAGAALLRLEVYGPDAACDGARLAPGAGAAESTSMFVPGEAIRLDIAPGRHTLVLTAFADAGGGSPIGEACTTADLAPGAQVCLDLTLARVDSDGGSAIDALFDGPPSDLPGCRSNSDCAPRFCRTLTRQCVDCLKQADCPGGKVCSPAGACVEGCDLDQGGPRTDSSIALAADPSRQASGGLPPSVILGGSSSVEYREYSPSSRLAIRAPRTAIIDRLAHSRALGV
ncbi:MAG: hypothetical protein EXR72_22030 [Myxococcales bacterium]|nr:hypothetical protein [Myxococcales bacterium]